MFLHENKTLSSVILLDKFNIESEHIKTIKRTKKTIALL